MEYPDQKPRHRGECASMPRPCPFISCRHHLVTVKAPKGRARDAGAKDYEEKDDATVDQILSAPETCSLDVADRVSEDRPLSLSEVGDLMGTCRERVRQIEMLQAAPKMRDGFADVGEEFKVQRGYRMSSRLCEPPMLIRKGARFFYPDVVKAAAVATLAEIKGAAGMVAAIDGVERATGKRPGHGTIRAWRRSANERA